MNIEDKKEIIRDYLRQNPTATYKQIKKDTKLKLERIYIKGNCVRSAYLDANIPFSKALLKRTKQQMKEQVIKYIQENPKTANTVTILKDLNINIPKIFGTIENAFNKSGEKYIQNYPIHGSAIPKIKIRAKKFEENILEQLNSFGIIKKKVRVDKRKEADGILNRKNKKYVIEIKNYTKRNPTMSDVKQLQKYMNLTNNNLGILIHSSPKKHSHQKIKLEDQEIIIINHKCLSHLHKII